MRNRNWGALTLGLYAMVWLVAAVGCAEAAPAAAPTPTVAPTSTPTPVPTATPAPTPTPTAVPPPPSAWSSAADGLDLQALAELIRLVAYNYDLEEVLNDPNEDLNNLDLDEDGYVDFLGVTQYGGGNSIGFSFTVDMGGGHEQEIVTVSIVKIAEHTVDVELLGDEQIYGPNFYYHESYGWLDYLMISYLYLPHEFYFSPYRYGVYPKGYKPYPTVSVEEYRARNASVVKTSRAKRSTSSAAAQANKATSPQAGKTS